MERHDFLAALHERVRPRTYVEVGIDTGQSLQLSRVPSVGIDPDYAVTAEIQADVHLVRTSSDTFFARKDPLAHLPGRVVDLAFIDGMHLAEYALRDYLSIERFTHPASVLVFDDMLPRTVEEASRHRRTRAWTGDVYKAAEALRALRPDLVLIEVDTEPTGVVVVLCPDATRAGVLHGYDEWLESAVQPDPQPVPEPVLSRSRAVAADVLLSAPAWGELSALRRASSDRASARIRECFAGYAG